MDKKMTAKVPKKKSVGKVDKNLRQRDSNYDPSDEECNDLDEQLDADSQLNVESELDSSNVAVAAAEDEVDLVIGKFFNL